MPIQIQNKVNNADELWNAMNTRVTKERDDVATKKNKYQQVFASNPNKFAGASVNINADGSIDMNDELRKALEIKRDSLDRDAEYKKEVTMNDSSGTQKLIDMGSKPNPEQEGYLNHVRNVGKIAPGFLGNNAQAFDLQAELEKSMNKPSNKDTKGNSITKRDPKELQTHEWNLGLNRKNYSNTLYMAHPEYAKLVDFMNDSINLNSIPKAEASMKMAQIEQDFLNNKIDKFGDIEKDALDPSYNNPDAADVNQLAKDNPDKNVSSSTRDSNSNKEGGSSGLNSKADIKLEAEADRSIVSKIKPGYTSFITQKQAFKDTMPINLEDAIANSLFANGTNAGTEIRTGVTQSNPFTDMVTQRQAVLNKFNDMMKNDYDLKVANDEVDFVKGTDKAKAEIITGAGATKQTINNTSNSKGSSANIKMPPSANPNEKMRRFGFMRKDGTVDTNVDLGEIIVNGDKVTGPLNIGKWQEYDNTSKYLKPFMDADTNAKIDMAAKAAFGAYASGKKTDVGGWIATLRDGSTIEYDGATLEMKNMKNTHLNKLGINMQAVK